MELRQLVKCEISLDKLMAYGQLPVKSIFFLSTMAPRIIESLNSYHNSKQSLIIKHGEKDGEGGYFVPAGDRAITCSAEIAELLDQDIDILFPPEKITLCIQSIDETDRQLPPEKRLGFTAKDWLAIQEVIKVVETEE